MPYDSTVTGRVIRGLRVRKGWSQEVLSGLAGIARSHLSEIETGDKNPTVDTLWRLADALGLRLSELIQMVEEDCESPENCPVDSFHRATGR